MELTAGGGVGESSAGQESVSMMGGGRTPFSGRFQAVLGLRDGDGVARGSAMEAMIRASLQWGKDDGGGGIGQWRRMWVPKIAAPAGDRIGGASRRLASSLPNPRRSGGRWWDPQKGVGRPIQIGGCACSWALN